MGKIEKKLSKWKLQYLSLGGILTLISSVLDSLPTHVMYLFPIPSKVEEKLDKLRRNFLWLGNKEGKGYHLVKQKTVQLNKETGDPGIWNLALQNKYLMMKWLWRFVDEEQALWKEVIQSKYGQISHWWCQLHIVSQYGSP